ncbi:MAG: alanine racemase, partial [Phycisphaerales bacterium]|nr:alanine racemase [Phycisphaerales bacterium]
MDDTSHVEIDLSAVDQNIVRLRELIGPGVGICPVLKSNAYGLGAVRVARRLALSGIDMFAVYTPVEAAELLAAGIPGTILVLMPVHQVGRNEPLYRALITGRVHLCAHDADHVAALGAIADHFAVEIALHLEIDTGISRGGCNEAEAPAVLRQIAEHPRLRLAGVCSHFSCADRHLTRTHEQMARFEQLLTECDTWIPDDCIIHVANTSATLRSTRFHQTMVRVGAAWAGYGPDRLQGEGPSLVDRKELRPVVTWMSRIVQVKRIPTGTGVGYGLTWTAQRPTTLGVVPVGYADGYPTALARRDDRLDTPACVGVRAETRGRHRMAFAPIVGAVSMDILTIDLTDILETFGESAVTIGTMIELIGPDHDAPNHMPSLARAAGLVASPLIRNMGT